VFSEVDAALNSPTAAAFGRAADILRCLGNDAALVLVSGKTRAELQFIQQKLDLNHPFVCENGGAVLIPDGYFGFDVPNARPIAGYQIVEFGRSYDTIVDLLHRAAERLRIPIVGFHDMSIEEVAQVCDLPLLQARLAKLREYEEPFRIADGGASARARLFKALHAASLRCVQGGRFDRVSSAVDPDVCVSLLNDLYRRRCATITVGLACAEDENQLLQLVDRAVILPGRSDSDAYDPIGWASIIVDTIEDIRLRAGARAALG
jgi:mannosyl-3-phosphoglycerate phosphatase